VAATVEAVEYLGADTVLVCRIAAAPFSARLAGHPPVKAGDSIRLSWEASDQHFFRRSDGVRVDPDSPARAEPRATMASR